MNKVRVEGATRLALASIALAGSAAHAQEGVGTSVEFLELLSEPAERPDHPTVMAGAKHALFRAMAPDWVVDRIRYWQTTDPLEVCFYGGTPALRKRIKDAAVAWQIPGTSIRFDFGQVPGLRTCDGVTRHPIRIGFRGREYRSDIGQESTARPAHKASMNFPDWDIRQVSDDEMQQIVAHEFGHALGFHHEHQNPWSKCESELDWNRIPALVAPYGWEDVQIKKNLKALHTDDVSTSGFDGTSIMVYSLPRNYFRNDLPKLDCFRAANRKISPIDEDGARTFYPESHREVVRQRIAAVETAKGFVAEAEAGSGVKAELIGLLSVEARALTLRHDR